MEGNAQRRTVTMGGQGRFHGAQREPERRNRASGGQRDATVWIEAVAMKAATAAAKTRKASRHRGG